jgi:hypothetical protein
MSDMVKDSVRLPVTRTNSSNAAEEDKDRNATGEER